MISALLKPVSSWPLLEPGMSHGTLHVLPRSSSCRSKTEAPRQNQARAYFQVTADTGNVGLLCRWRHQRKGSGCARPVGLSSQASLNKKRRGAELPHTPTGLRGWGGGTSRCQHLKVLSPGPGPHSCVRLLGPLSRQPRGVSNLAARSLVTSLNSTDSLPVFFLV